MKKYIISILSIGLAVALSACAMTVKPTYTSTNVDLLRIGGEKPSDKEPETIHAGSYCLQIAEKWKADGKTPDGQTIWTRDCLRKVIPCP